MEGIVQSWLGLLAAGTLLVGAVGASAAPPAAAVPEIPRVDNVDVKGNTVADWHGQGLLIRALGGSETTIRPADQSQAAARLGWNDEGLLLHVDVTDTTPDEVSDNNRLYQGDSVDLELMTADKAGGLVQAIAAPGRTTDNPKPRIQLFDYRSADLRARVPAVPPRVAVQANDHGYTMDMLLPWANLEIKPQAGMEVGVRFSVADLAGRNVAKAIFYNGWTTSPWMDLPAVRLSDKPGVPAPAAATWGGYDGFTEGYVNVVADPDHAGQTVTVRAGEETVATGKLTADGERAIAALRFAAPARGKTFHQLAVQMAGQPIGTIDMPDLEQQRVRAFLSGGGGFRGFGRGGPAWLQLTCGNPVFSGASFPTFDYPEPQKVNDLVGSYALNTAYFDAKFHRVAAPAAPGRYGAVTQVISDAGDSYMKYTTLYRLPDGQTAPADASAAQLAARAQHADAGQADAARLDRDWWHALRGKINTSVRYEYYLTLPKGYDADTARKWPVIFYLHGSGGGNNPHTQMVDGPAAAASSKADFPFILVALRSPGGWDPPAVRDVIDEVAATCRTDPSRYYLTGFSMGGGGTWSVAMDEPQRFAAIVPIASRGASVEAAQSLKTMPIWIINGSLDRGTAGPAGQAAEALKAAGFNVKWTLIQGADHGQSHAIAYNWDDLYKWLLEHHR